MQDYNNYGNYGNNRRKFENFDLGNIDYSGGNSGGMNEVDMIKERLFQDFLAGQGIIQGNNNNGRPHSNGQGGRQLFKFWILRRRQNIPTHSCNGGSWYIFHGIHFIQSSLV